MSSKSKTILSLFLFVMLYAAGCGGGGGGSTPPPPPPTITSVSASCNPLSVEANTTQTSQCSATVTGTGSYSSGVTWSAKYGTITSAGVYSAPATRPASGTDTITATSTEDTTKSGPTSVAITPAPTITSVSVVCNQTSLQAHQTTTTSQCTPTVTGTGSYSSAVTWSANYGTITTAGVYTAPATVPTPPTAIITATSTEDGTESGPADITITAARVITLTPKYPVASQAEAIPGNTFSVVINATGIQAGDVIDTTELGTTTPYTIVAADVTNGDITLHIGIDEIPSFVQFTCPTSTNAVCNPAWVAITTDQQQLAESKDGTTAYFNPGYGFEIQEFSLSSGASEGNVSPPLQTSLPSLLSNDNYAVAVDSGSGGTGTVLSDVAVQAVNSNAGSGTTGVIQPGSKGLPTDAMTSIVARNGFGYVTEPNVNAPNPGDLAQFPISTTSGLGTISTVAAGAGPYAVDAATVNSADAIVVFSADTTVRQFSNALTLKSTLTAGLTNITPLGTVATTNTSQGSAIGGWPLRIIGGTGTAAGTVGLLSPYDNALDFLTINSSNVISWAGATNGAVTFSGSPYPYMIAPDPTHGAFILASADTTNGVTTLQSISATSPYTSTTITSASALPVGFLASGILVSDDGSKIYLAGFNASSAPDPANILFIDIANH
ncbi:MAG: hypothetical protein ABSE55_01305 [Terracidiphilus sp.]|jgi:hypothetical protein